MCDNAAVYNKSKSQVHSDALRLRKLVESFEEPAAAGVNTDHADASQPTPGRPSRGSKAGPGALQQAMLKIIDDMLGLTHERYVSNMFLPTVANSCNSGDLVAQYFKNLPSRKFYADYYRVISRPTSITQIQKNVKAGKYQQWSEFEEDFGLIKKNAEEYNAEGSDIVRDARLLEVCLYAFGSAGSF